MSGLIAVAVMVGLVWLARRAAVRLHEFVAGLPALRTPPQPDPYDEAYDAEVRAIARRNGARDAWRDHGS